MFIPTSYLSSCCRRCFYPCHCHLYNFPQHNFAEFSVHQISHIYYWKRQIKAHYAQTLFLGLRHRSPFLMLYLQLPLKSCIHTPDLKESPDAKGGKKASKKSLFKGQGNNYFFVNSNLSLTLIGPLSPQQSSWLMKRFVFLKKNRRVGGKNEFWCFRKQTGPSCRCSCRVRAGAENG